MVVKTFSVFLESQCRSLLQMEIDVKISALSDSKKSLNFEWAQVEPFGCQLDAFLEWGFMTEG